MFWGDGCAPSPEPLFVPRRAEYFLAAPWRLNHHICSLTFRHFAPAPHFWQYSPRASNRLIASNAGSLVLPTTHPYPARISTLFLHLPFERRTRPASEFPEPASLLSSFGFFVSFHFRRWNAGRSAHPLCQQSCQSGCKASLPSNRRFILPFFFLGIPPDWVRGMPSQKEK